MSTAFDNQATTDINLIGVDVSTVASVTSAVEVFEVATVVIASSLLGVGQDSVGLSDLLELLLMLLLLVLSGVGMTICKRKNIVE